MYSGQLDLIVDALGTLQWLEKLSWPGMKGFRATDKKPLVAQGHTAGFYKAYKKLAFFWVLNAGHMVPSDAPEVAEDMARRIFAGVF